MKLIDFRLEEVVICSHLPVYETEKLHSNKFDGSVVLSAQVII